MDKGVSMGSIKTGRRGWGVVGLRARVVKVRARVREVVLRARVVRFRARVRDGVMVV